MMFGGAGRGGIVSLCHEKGDLGLSYFLRSMHTIHSTSTTLDSRLRTVVAGIWILHTTYAY